MEVECPYCSTTVDVTALEHHVRNLDGEGHGPHGTVPIEGVDNPWNLRLEATDPPEDDADVPTVEYVLGEARRGWCPACERGVLGLKGGGGLFSSGPRRLACPDCGWVSPEWLRVRR